MTTRSAIPSTPRVISPTPTPTENRNDSYFAPITRSATKRSTATTFPISEEETSSDSSLEKRARARSRSPKSASKPTSTSTTKKPTPTTSPPSTSSPKSNGHLSPSSAFTTNNPETTGSSYWRTISRSPSPLGLIPIHRHWRSFIHRHEIPRKALHVSIGFVTLTLYSRGTSASAIHPWLLRALIPIASVDYLRHTFPGLNRIYVKGLGALMRESEVGGYNGVIWYLLGAWAVLRFLPKDVGVMSVLLLSWCDTAASTFGRLYGRYTPRIRRGKSVAGTAAACVVGCLTAVVFYGWAVPRYGYDDGFLFTGTLGLPEGGWGLWADGVGSVGGIGSAPSSGTTMQDANRIGGALALGVVSLWSGIIASASEVVDLFGWDDNLTIPVLSGLGLWGFLKVFAC